MTTITMTIFEEAFAVAKAAGVKDQLPAQSEQDFLFSILKVLSSVPDPVWEGLSLKTQKWVDAAIRANNATQPIMEPEGYREYCKSQPFIIEAVPGINPAVPSIKYSGATSRVQSVTPNIANTPKVKSTIEAKVEITKLNPKPEGVVSAIRKTIILNHDWTTRKVHEYLVANGWPNLKLDVVSVNAGDIRKTVEMVKQLNKWKD